MEMKMKGVLKRYWNQYEVPRPYGARNDSGFINCDVVIPNPQG